MKVLLVNGSPHEKGCTYTALHHVAKALDEQGVNAQIYWIGNKALHGCMDCGKCAELHQCAISDNVNALRELAAEHDGFVFGTPVYYAGMNGSLKAFMDRLFFSDLWGRNNTFTMKPAASVITARRAGATAAFDQINKYFAHCQMPIVSSTYWNLAYGMKPEQIEQDAEGIYTMENLGRNIELKNPEITIDGDTATLTCSNVIDARIYGSRGTWTLSGGANFEKDDGHWSMTQPEGN